MYPNGCPDVMPVDAGSNAFTSHDGRIAFIVEVVLVESLCTLVLRDGQIVTRSSASGVLENACFAACSVAALPPMFLFINCCAM